MPSVKQRKKTQKSTPPKTVAPGREAAVRQTRDASSVLFGLVILVALIIAAAAWMGGSISIIERRVTGTLDDMARSVGLSVARVDFVGIDPAKEGEFSKLVNVDLGSNMFRADPYRLQTELEDTDHVAEAQVHRLWPDQILVILEPTEASALWQKDGEWQVVDDAGRVMENTRASRAMQLPKVVGDGGDVAAPTLFQDMELYPEIRDKVEAAIRVGNRRWDLQMKNGSVVHLSADHKNDLSRLSTAHFESRLLDRPVGTIDLRDPRRMYVSRRTKFNDDLAGGG